MSETDSGKRGREQNERKRETVRGEREGEIDIEDERQSERREKRVRNGSGRRVILIIWELYIQIPMQSVPITTKVGSLNSVHGEVSST